MQQAATFTGLSIGTKKEGAARMRARLKQLLRAGCRCYYCKNQVFRYTNKQGKPEPGDMATVEHLFSRLDIRRLLQDFDRDTVLACRACNQTKANEQVFEMMRGFDYTEKPLFTLLPKDQRILINPFYLKQFKRMETMQTPAVQTNALPEINAAKIMEVYSTLKEKESRAVAALSKIQTITSDEQDQAANDLLVKVRKTMEGYQPKEPGATFIPGIVTLRKEITKKADQLKAILMEPENAIVAEAERITKIRNQYATQKVQRQREEAARIEREQKIKDEIARIKKTMREAILEGIIKTVYKVSDSIQEYMKDVTLENWDEKTEIFNVTPKLKEGVYELFFSHEYDTDLIDSTTYLAIRAEVQKEETYQKVNEGYVKEASRTVQQWKDDLPNLKARLQAIAETKQTDPVAAANETRQMQEQQAQKRAEEEARMHQEQEALKAQIARDNEEERLRNDMAAQAEKQAAGKTPKHLRKNRVALLDAAITNPAENIVGILKACLENPKFGGWLKYDSKTGNPVEKDGFPVYADFLQPLLTFIAKEHDGELPGVVFNEKITTTAKA